MSYKSDKSALWVWRTRLLCAALIPSFLSALIFKFGTRWFWIATAAWIGLYIALAFVYFPLWYRTLNCTISDGSLSVSSGIFFRTCRSTAFEKIQYTMIAASPFQRLFGTGTVMLFAAGGNLMVPNLARADCCEICRLVEERQARGNGGQEQ